MKIPSFESSRQDTLLADELVEAFQKVLQHGKYILGEEVQEFETRIAHYLGVDFAFGVANGSDALVLALQALEIGAGDEVIVPAFTFFATAGAVSRVGATPVFVDVTSDYNLNPQAVKQKITSKTKAIIPVHLFGLPASMGELMKLASEYNLAVIEDAAQAIGSTYEVDPVGTLGELGCFSFFPTKNLGALGDAGLVVTNRADLAEKIKILRVHGAKQKYHHELLGFNSRLDTLQAAFLNVKLTHLNGWIAARRKIAKRYYTALIDCQEIGLPEDYEGHTYNQFTITTAKRNELRDFLEKAGISTTIYYPLTLPEQPVFAGLGYRQGDFPVSEKLTKTVLSLPIYPELTETEQNYIVGKLQQFFSRKGHR